MMQLMAEELSLSAKRILTCFRERGLRAHGMIHPTEFGDAVIWEAGFIRDEEVRKAWAEIIAEGYVIEHAAALELTLKGQQFLYGDVLAEPLKVENVQDALLAILDVIDSLRTDLDVLTKVVADAGIDAPSFRAVIELNERSKQIAPVHTNDLRSCIKSLGTPKS